MRQLLLVALVAGQTLASAASAQGQSYDLHRAAAAGDVNEVEHLIRSGSPVDERLASGATALILACNRPNVDVAVVAALLDAGADPNAATGDGLTPLLCLASHKQPGVDVFQRLIDQGAEATRVGPRGRTSLEVALDGDLPADVITWLAGALKRQGGRSVLDRRLRTSIEARRADHIRLLAANGADVNRRGQDGLTPLLVAAERAPAPIMELLIQLGADPKARRPDKATVTHLAVFNDDPTVLEVAIREGAPIDDLDVAKASPLMAAVVMRGSKRHAQTLLEAGADPTVPLPDGRTMLLHTLEAEDLSIADELLKHGADPNARGSSRNTPLERAATAQDEALVRTLLAAGADPKRAMTEALRGESETIAGMVVDALDDVDELVEDGLTPLMIAACSPAGKTSHLDLVLNRRADVNALSKAGLTALHEACAKNNTVNARKLLEAGADLNAGTYYDSAIMVALKSNAYEAVQLLIDSGADVNARMRDGSTLLMFAVDNIRPSATVLSSDIQFLLRAGADPRPADEDGNTALSRAVRRGLVIVVRDLLRGGADPNRGGERGQTPLIFSAQVGCAPCAGDLIQAGADVDMRSDDGSTAMHAAARNGNADVLRVLVEAGGDVSAPNQWGQTPLMVGLQSVRSINCDEDESLAWIDVLVTANAEIRSVDRLMMTPLHHAALAGQWCLIERLVRAGILVDARDSAGRTPLMHAMGNGKRAEAAAKTLLALGASPTASDREGVTVLGHGLRHTSNSDRDKLATPEMLRALLDAGADPNRRDSQLRTPLMLAARAAHLEGLRVLLAAGADPHARDTDGRNAFHFAAMSSPSTWTLPLSEAGADVNAADHNGATPLFAAVRRDQPRAIEALLDAGADPTRLDHFGRSAVGMAARSARAVSLAPLVAALPEGDVRDAVLAGALVASMNRQSLAKLNLLLDAGADPSAARVSGEGLLVSVIQLSYGTPQEHAVAVTRLLEAGADPNEPDRSMNSTPLSAAATRSNLEIVRVLLDHGANPNLIPDRGVSPLAAAVGQREPDMALVELLLDRGALVDVGATPALFHAARSGTPAALRLLCDAGARIDRRDRKGSSPLFVAASRGNVSAVEFLLARGAPADDRQWTEQSTTALMAAAALNTPEATRVVELLLESGAPPSSEDSEGRTALTEACARGNIETVRRLCSNGANPSQRDQRGRSAYDHASSRRDGKADEIVELLRTLEASR